MSKSAIFRELMTIKPTPKGRVPFAIRAGICMFAPVALGYSMGNIGAGLVASMGGFTALYGSDLSFKRRAFHLLWVALGLIIAIAIGRAVSTEGMWIIPIVALFAMLATAACHTYEVPPPGSYMFLLTCAASSGMHDPAITPAVGASLVGGAALFSWLVQMSGALSAKARANAREIEKACGKDVSIGLMARLDRTFGIDKPALYVVLRVGIAAALAGAIASFLGFQRIYWAVAVAVVVLNKGIEWEGTVLRSFERALGTWIGVILACVILLNMPHGYWLALLLGVLQFIIEILVPRRYTLAVIFITCAGVTLGTGGVAPQDILAYASARGLDTLVGAIVAIVVYKLLPIPQPTVTK